MYILVLYARATDSLNGTDTYALNNCRLFRPWEKRAARRLALDAFLRLGRARTFCFRFYLDKKIIIVNFTTNKFIYENKNAPSATKLK